MKYSNVLYCTRNQTISEAYESQQKELQGHQDILDTYYPDRLLRQ